MTRMFTIDGIRMKTWNVFVGCQYNCVYCNARRCALTRLKNVPRYKDGFEPHLVEREMRRRFRTGDFVFVGYMGDISFASREVIINILANIERQPGVNFLFCTKSPIIYWYWNLIYPDNLYLGATIETNVDYGLSKAPSPYHRYVAMRALDHPYKFISIEPIMDFHLTTFVAWIREIDPSIIEVGADNYKNSLLEPPWWKVERLLKSLNSFCPIVVEKEGLHRLKKE